MSGVDSPSAMLELHSKLLEHTLQEWNSFYPVGNSYTSELKRQVSQSL